MLATGPFIYHASSLAVLVGHGAAVLVYLIAVTLVAVAWVLACTPPVRVVAGAP